MLYYFAYGSNLSKDQLRERIGEWKEARKGVLENYQLTFDSRGKADIIKKLGKKVHGILYFITQEQLDTLDDYEGVKSGVYKRLQVKIKSDGDIVNAITYERTIKTAFCKPEAQYLNRIISGLEQHGFDRKVVDEVKRIANV